jgi:hypothetical protein
MWANNVKPKKAVKNWHGKALMIDLRKTLLVIDREDVKSTYVLPWIYKWKSDAAVHEFFLWLTDDTDCMARAHVDNLGGF